MPDDDFQQAADACEALVLKDPHAEAYRRYVQWFIMPHAMLERLGMPTTKVGIARALWPDDEVEDEAVYRRLYRFEQRETFDSDCRSEAENMLQKWEGPLLIQGLEMAMRGDRESYPYWSDLAKETGLIDDTQRVEVNHTVEVQAVMRMSEKELKRTLKEDLRALPAAEGKSEEELEAMKEGFLLATELGVVKPKEAHETDQRYEDDSWRRDLSNRKEPTV